MATYEGADLPDGVKLYDFEDFDTHRKLIFDDAMDALANQFPKEHNGVRMELDNLHYVDKDHYTIREQKKALHDDVYLMRRLRGTVKLTDSNTGEVLDSKDMTLMRVPYLTDRGTFIRSGNEWASISQQRMLPGAYSRVQKNGNFATQFNVRPGTGNAFQVLFNPESTQYKFAIAGSELHLYSLLHDMGVSDDTLKKSWGDTIFQQNADKYDARVLEKAYNKIVPEWDRKKNPGRTKDEKIALIKNALERSQIATNVVKRTLPNLFDMRKSAAWREGGQLMEKCANISKEQAKEIATYINAVSGTSIDTESAKEALEQQIVNVIRTGYADGNLTTNRVDMDNPGVAAVRKLATEKALAYVKASLNKLPKVNPEDYGF